jgi:hypothetical protein
MARTPYRLTSRFASALAGVLLVAPACFLVNRAKSEGGPAADAAEEEIVLSVTNHNYLDVVIYVLQGGVSTRVGTVTGSSAADFVLRERLFGQGRVIQLLGDPIGSTDFARTETILVQRGQRIEWTLETDLRRSSVSVF